ncbi:MAG: non-hydrolyzing UDP-N-acetylglucosamine 2-epimerase [bacterium]
MNKLKVMVIIGTRPEAIKMASIIRVLKQNQTRIKVIVVTTAQHRDLVDSVLRLFAIKPQVDCNIMQKQQTLSQITIRALSKLSHIIDTVNPQVVLVQGDTTSAFAGALAAFYHKVPIGHVEAGLRSFDKYNPYPEEINRKFISAIADWHFAPTKTAKLNLIKENITPSKIFVTGNTGIDALLYFAKQNYIPNIPELKKVDWTKRIILVETHRRENWGQPMRNICSSLKDIIERNQDLELIFPCHPNPQVYRTVNSMLGKKDRMHIFVATKYSDFVQLMKKAYLILSDSGGIQEEAPVLGKPVLVLRKVTERPEAVRAGAIRVVGTNIDSIISNTQLLLDYPTKYRNMAKNTYIYGDGKAASRIINILFYHLGLKKSLPQEF